jgi:hypothetical protein
VEKDSNFEGRAVGYTARSFLPCMPHPIGTVRTAGKAALQG